jgi:hypothetical protein
MEPHPGGPNHAFMEIAASTSRQRDYSGIIKHSCVKSLKLIEILHSFLGVNC